jgi:hypothetical protein
MSIKSPEGERNLFKLAQEQGGYFTAMQAEGLGYAASKRNFPVGAGNGIRERRGHLPPVPISPTGSPGSYPLVALVAREKRSPVGVFSHQTGAEHPRTY